MILWEAKKGHFSEFEHLESSTDMMEASYFFLMIFMPQTFANGFVPCRTEGGGELIILSREFVPNLHFPESIKFRFGAQL